MKALDDWVEWVARWIERRESEGIFSWYEPDQGVDGGRRKVLDVQGRAYHEAVRPVLHGGIQEDSTWVQKVKRSARQI